MPQGERNQNNLVTGHLRIRCRIVSALSSLNNLQEKKIRVAVTGTQLWKNIMEDLPPEHFMSW